MTTYSEIDNVSIYNSGDHDIYIINMEIRSLNPGSGIPSSTHYESISEIIKPSSIFTKKIKAKIDDGEEFLAIRTKSDQEFLDLLRKSQPVYRRTSETCLVNSNFSQENPYFKMIKEFYDSSLRTFESKGIINYIDLHNGKKVTQEFQLLGLVSKNVKCDKEK